MTAITPTADLWRTAMNYVVGRKRAEEALGFLTEIGRATADPVHGKEVLRRVHALARAFFATSTSPDTPVALTVPLREGTLVLRRATPFSAAETAIAEEVGRRVDAALTIVQLRGAPAAQPSGPAPDVQALESNVRAYSRLFPAVFDRASGCYVESEDGRRWVDFFCGAGALNYGHNPPAMMRAVVEYIERDGVLHSLDMATAARARFLDRFANVILRPRGLDFRVQFCGPTGANAVEAALKLARKNTGRTRVVAFERSYHGMSLGALSVTWHPRARGGAGVPLPHVSFAPFDDPELDVEQALAPVAVMLAEDDVAAVIVETVQAEGGVRTARAEWLQGLRRLTRECGTLLIVDDIQAGCGRTGPFFSFEPAGIEPDLVCLSKSIGGCGLPMSLLLLRPELDTWLAGEHNGTFRGQNLAFVAAAEALRFWQSSALTEHVAEMSRRLTARLRALAPQFTLRGRGLLLGLDVGSPERADAICAAGFARGLLVESAHGGVVKLAPPLIAGEAVVDHAIDILGVAIQATEGER